jgi:hypothetical protein
MISAISHDGDGTSQTTARPAHQGLGARRACRHVAAILLAGLWTAAPASAQISMARAIESSLARMDHVEVITGQSDGSSPGATVAGKQEAIEPLSVLRSRTAAGELVVVRTMAGEEIAGTIDAVTDTELTLRVGDGVRRVPAAQVQQVVSARRTSLWRRGLLIGAGAGVLGAVMRCIDPMDTGGTDCSSDAIGILVVSPAIGMLVGSMVRRDRILYSTGPVEEPEEELGEERTAPALEDIGSVVKPLQTLYVRTTDGGQLEGRFVRVSPASLTLEDAGQTFDVPAERIGEVRIRGGRRWRRGMVIGTLSGVAFGTAAVLMTADSDEDRSWAILGAMAGGVYGLGIGALLGTFAHDRPVVYEKGPVKVAIAPVLSPRFIGVRASITF